MKFTIAHNNLNVVDIEKCYAFYHEAFGLEIVKKIESPDGKMKLWFLGDGVSPHQIELTYMEGNIPESTFGRGEHHTAFLVEDMKAAHDKHEAMGAVRFGDPELAYYYIQDPEGHWLEVLPR